MSGTSADGIDVALMKISGSNCFRILDTLAINYDDRLRVDVLQLCQTQHAQLQSLGELQQRLSQAYADAVNQLLTQYGLDFSEVAAIGCHGQTICHIPDANFPFTMQLADPALIQVKTGIP
jgi:anhydro-N-acetylmuramic acid kinase